MNDGRPASHVAWASTLIAILTAAVIATDGWQRSLAALALVCLPTLSVARHRGRWSRVWVLLLIVPVSLASLGVAAADIDEHYGAVRHVPVQGNSDQIDFTMMAWTWAEHGLVGTSTGGPAARAVVDQYAPPARELPFTQRNLGRWRALAERPDEPHRYSYRAVGYPLLLGTVWKATGYRPDLGPVVNIVLHVVTVSVLAAALALLWSPAAGVASGLVVVVATEPLWWTGQAMSETLSVCLAAVVAIVLVRLVRFPGIGWFTLLGLLLGLLALTKQMFLFASWGLLVGVAVVLALRPGSRRGAVIRGTAVAGGAMTLLIVPWLAYNVHHTGNAVLALGTAGWHDMPASYSREYLAGLDRVVVRERTFDAYEEASGAPVIGETQRALVGRQIWLAEARAGEYTARLPALVAHKFVRSSAADGLGWTIRLLALAALFVVVRLGTRRDRESAFVLLALPICLMAFIVATVEAGDRLMVTSWAFLAALVGLGVHVGLVRPSPRVGAAGRSVD